jgi:hypothetical protein
MKNVAELFHLGRPSHKKPEIHPQRKKMPHFKASGFLFSGTFFQFSYVFLVLKTWHGVCFSTRAVKRPMDWVTTNKSL